MLGIVVVTNAWALHTWRKNTPAEGYTLHMKCLAIPFIFQTSFRSIFPNEYVNRQVLLDNPLSSILLARCLATVGELCWITQISLALRQILTDLQPRGRRTQNSHSQPLAVVATLPLLFISLAECCSFYGTATTDQAGFAFEESLWGMSFTCFTPVAVVLFLACHNLPPTSEARSAVLFTGVLAVFGIIYVPWEFLDNVPRLFSDWEADQEAGKSYISFLPGLEDAATTRHPTSNLEDWKGDLFWRTAYFSLCVWSSILLMNGPRVTSAQSKKGQYELVHVDHTPAVASHAIPEK